MLLPIAAVFLGTHLAMTVADGFPTFPVDADCHDVAGLDPTTARKKEDCVRDEQVAHDQAERQWGQFSPADRDLCIRTAKLGPDPSYVQLLTCLEMRRDVKSIPDSQGIPSPGK